MSTQPVFNHYFKRYKNRKPTQQHCHRPRHLKRSIHRAYQNFARQHPRYAASLFDEHFLVKTLSPAKQSSGEAAKRPSAQALARAWAAQFYSPGESQGSFDGVESVAADFLAYLERECDQSI